MLFAGLHVGPLFIQKCGYCSKFLSLAQVWTCAYHVLPYTNRCIQRSEKTRQDSVTVTLSVRQFEWPSHLISCESSTRWRKKAKHRPSQGVNGTGRDRHLARNVITSIGVAVAFVLQRIIVVVLESIDIARRSFARLPCDRDVKLLNYDRRRFAIISPFEVYPRKTRCIAEGNI